MWERLGLGERTGTNLIKLPVWNLITAGFNICILMLKLRAKYPKSAKLKHLAFTESYGDRKTDLSELGGRNESIVGGFLLRAKRLLV
jgi:hypothetical protein